MGLITWNDAFNVNVKEVDDQHKVLVGYMNDLNDAMLAGHGQDVMTEIIDRLLDYTVWHFGNEEVYFEKFDYVEMENHKKEHEKFISQIKVQQIKYKNGDKSVPTNLLSFLYGWLIQHIKSSDKRYVACFHHNGVY